MNLKQFLIFLTCTQLQALSILCAMGIEAEKQKWYLSY